MAVGEPAQRAPTMITSNALLIEISQQIFFPYRLMAPGS
jgi:hypothetical protein